MLTKAMFTTVYVAIILAVLGLKSEVCFKLAFLSVIVLCVLAIVAVWQKE